MSTTITESLLRPRVRLSLIAISVVLIFTALLDNTLRHGRISEASFRNRTQTGYLRTCDDCEQLDSSKMNTLAKQIKEMYKPVILPINKDAEEYEQTWDKLGKDFCIADIDTRSYDKEGQILSDTFDWNATDSLSAGMFNHFFYGMCRGSTCKTKQIADLQ